MSLKLIEERLKEYSIQNKQDELNALKEISQEIALSTLSRADFFKKAAFQGGTCLRIIYGLNRFSEDMDFVLFHTNPSFLWQPYLYQIQEEFTSYGLHLEAQDRSETDQAVKKAFLKEDSFGELLILTYPRNRSDVQKIQIKLEIDTHPPQGSHYESKFLDFPYPFSIVLQDPPSLFAGKCHALLCRPYTKGRDWFDFVWYVSRKTFLNIPLLENALNQQGPWQDKKIPVTKEWLHSQLMQKIQQTDWEKAKRDVENFLKQKERESLKLWSVPFFLAMLEKLVLN